MKVYQLKRAISNRGGIYLFGAALLASAEPMAAQTQLEPSKWEVGLTPTVQVISQKLAGDVVWAGGLTASAQYRRDQYVAISASLLTGFAPQLNFKNSSPVNSLVGQMSAELHRPSMKVFDPYVSVGVGHAMFQYSNPPAGLDQRQSYALIQGGLGMRYALTDRFNFRAEIGRQFSKFGGSPTFMSGLTIRIHDKKGAN